MEDSVKKVHPLVFVCIFLIIRFWMISWSSVISDLSLYHEVLMKNDSVYDPRFSYPWLARMLVAWPLFFNKSIDFVSYRSSIQIFSLTIECILVAYFYWRLCRGELSRSIFNIFLGCYLIFSTMLGNLLFDRIDFFMMVSLFIAFLVWNNKKRFFLWVSLFVGFSIKLLPLGFWVYKLAEMRRPRWIDLGRMCLFPICCILSLFVADRYFYPGMLDALRGHWDRGIQVESLWASPFWIGLVFNLSAPKAANVFGSFDVSANVIPAWYLLMSKTFGFGILAVFAFFIGSGRVRLINLKERNSFFLLIILTFLSFQRVLSTQFLIWPIPFVSLLLAMEWRLSRFLLYTLVYGLTFFIFQNFIEIILGNRLVLVCLIIRNIIILYLWIDLIWSFLCKKPLFEYFRKLEKSGLKF